MRSIVTFLLLALLGAVVAFLISNTTPIALTFLGMQTVALPLALWIAGALLAGIATGLWFLILFRLAERQGAKREREQRRAEFGPDDFAVVDEGMDSREYAGASGYRDESYRNEGYGDRDYRYDDYRDREVNFEGSRYAEVGYPEAGYSADYSKVVDSEPNRPNWQNQEVRDAEGEGGYGDSTYSSGRSSSHHQRSEQESRAEPYHQDPQEEFEVIEAQAPVYDANYRVIQPPAVENDWQVQDRPRSSSGARYGEQESYGAESSGFGSVSGQTARDRATSNTATEGYGLNDTVNNNAAEFSGNDASQSASASTSAASAQAASIQPNNLQRKSQPQDDWDIEGDLDW